MSSIVLALGTTAVAYVYPLYATYKALVSTSNMVLPAGQDDQQTEKPTELSELETWTMYWCVVSLFWAIDTWLGWAFRWCVCANSQEGSFCMPMPNFYLLVGSPCHRREYVLDLTTGGLSAVQVVCGTIHERARGRFRGHARGRSNQSPIGGQHHDPCACQHCPIRVSGAPRGIGTGKGCRCYRSSEWRGAQVRSCSGSRKRERHGSPALARHGPSCRRHGHALGVSSRARSTASVASR